MTSNTVVLAKLREDILLRGLSEHTVDSYVLNAGIFLKYCGKPVEQINEIDIRRFLCHLTVEKKSAPGTVNCYGAAIRFLFAVTLNRTLNYLQIPLQKKPKTLPEILTREEIGSILERCENIKHKAMLTLAYSSGLRVSEVAKLKVQHIDSKNMRVFIDRGKGGKDRYTILSETCLLILREYWRAYRPKHPENWMFLGVRGLDHMSAPGIRHAFNKAISRTAVTKDVSIHSLRHAFATHLLEDGVDLLHIKELMGHTSIRSTTVYLHLANVTSGIISPLDKTSVYSYPLAEVNTNA